MRLIRTSLDGYAYFAENAIDWSTMGQVVAIVGKTGAGKTALAESPLQCLYGQTPTYSSPPIDAFTTYPGYLETEVESAGHLLRARIERRTRTQIRWSCWIDGVEQPTRGRKADTVAALAPYLPPLEVLRSSAFADQDRAMSLVSMTPAKRTALLVTLLGERLARDEAAAKRCRDTANALPLERLRGRVDALRGVDVEAARQRVETATEAHRAARATAEAAEAAIESWRRVVSEHEQERAGLQRRIEHHQRLAREVATAARASEQARERLAGERAALHTADLLSAEQLEELKAENVRLADALREVDGSIGRAQHNRRALEQAQHNEREARRKLEQAEARQREAERRHSEAVAAEQAREVPCRGGPAYIGYGGSHEGTVEVDCSTCPLLVAASSDTAGAVADAAARLGVAMQIAAEATVVLGRIEREREDIALAVEHSDEHAAEERRLREAVAANGQRLTAHARTDQQRTRIAHAQTAADEAELLEREARDALAALGDPAAWHARLAELQPPPRPDAADRAAVSNAAAELGRAEAALSQAERQVRERAEAEQRASVAAAAVGDLEIGALLLGAKGSQALEIARAAPSISRWATEIIDLIEPGRWEITLSTRREGSKGATIAETTIHIFDRERGRGIADASLLSGGQRAMVDESLRLAIAAYAAGNSSHPSATLWRDEGDKNLSPALRRRYPAMLRRAFKLAKAERLIFVTHDPTVARSADTVIVVRGGLALPYDPANLPEVY